MKAWLRWFVKTSSGRLIQVREAGITTIIVEQNAVAALKLADRAMILDTGEIVFTGSRPKKC